MGLEDYVKLPCSTKYKAVHTSGGRPKTYLHNVVIHSTESDSAESSARWFTDPDSGGSANLVIDDKACFRTVDDLVIPQAAPGLNTMGFHIEFTGHSSWSKARWLLHQRMLHRAAFKAAQRAKWYSIPVAWLNVDQVRKGVKGFTSHRMVTKAFPTKGDHVDPGPNFPYAYWLSLVKGYRKVM